MPVSNGAAAAVGLERLGLCIVGRKQASASRGQTTEAVALRSSAKSTWGDCFVDSSIVSSAMSRRQEQSSVSALADACMTPEWGTRSERSSWLHSAPEGAI